jgi:hypothetical protein
MVKWDLPNPTSSCKSIHSSMLGRARACRVVRDDDFDEFDRSGAIVGWLDSAVSYITGWPTKEGSLCLDHKKRKPNPVISWKSSKNHKPKRISLLATVREGADDSNVEGADDSILESGQESMYCTTTTTTSSVENDDGSHSSSAVSSSDSSDDSTISTHVKPKMKTILIPMATSPRTVTSTYSSISASTYYHSTVSTPTGAQQKRDRRNTSKKTNTYQRVVVIDLTAFSDLSNNNSPSIETAAAVPESYEKEVVPDLIAKISSSSLHKASKNLVEDDSASPVVPESPKSDVISASPPPIIPSPSVELASAAKQPRSRHGRREDPPASSASPTSPGDQLKNSEKSPTQFRYGSPEKARRDRPPEKKKTQTMYNLPACPSGVEEQPKTTSDKRGGSPCATPAVDENASQPEADTEPPTGQSTSTTTTSTASIVFSSSNDSSEEEEEGKETPLHSLSSHTTTHNTSHSVGSSRDKSFPTTTTATTSISSNRQEPEKNKRGGRERRRRLAKKYAMDDCKPIIPRKIRPTSRPKNPYFAKFLG